MDPAHFQQLAKKLSQIAHQQVEESAAIENLIDVPEAEVGSYIYRTIGDSLFKIPTTKAATDQEMRRIDAGVSPTALGLVPVLGQVREYTSPQGNTIRLEVNEPSPEGVEVRIVEATVGYESETPRVIGQSGRLLNIDARADWSPDAQDLPHAAKKIAAKDVTSMLAGESDAKTSAFRTIMDYVRSRSLQAPLTYLAQNGNPLGKFVMPIDQTAKAAFTIWGIVNMDKDDPPTDPEVVTNPASIRTKYYADIYRKIHTTYGGEGGYVVAPDDDNDDGPDGRNTQSGSVNDQSAETQDDANPPNIPFESRRSDDIDTLRDAPVNQGASGSGVQQGQLSGVRPIPPPSNQNQGGPLKQDAAPSYSRRDSDDDVMATGPEDMTPGDIDAVALQAQRSGDDIIQELDNIPDPLTFDVVQTKVPMIMALPDINELDVQPRMITDFGTYPPEGLKRNKYVEWVEKSWYREHWWPRPATHKRKYVIDGCPRNRYKRLISDLGHQDLIDLGWLPHPSSMTPLYNAELARRRIAQHHLNMS